MSNKQTSLPKGAKPSLASRQDHNRLRVPKAPALYEGVEILNYVEGKPSPNLLSWEKGLKSALTTKYSDLSRFLDSPTLEYWTPPEIDLPTAAEEAADALTGGYARDRRKDRMRRRDKLIEDMEKEKAPCFEFIINTLSFASVEVGLSKLDNYEDEIKSSRNPALLIEAIHLVHSTAFSATPALMVKSVEDGYTDLKQHKCESPQHLKGTMPSSWISHRRPRS